MYPKSGVSLCLLLSPYVMVLCSCAHAALPNSNSAITYRLEGVRPNPLEPPLRTPLHIGITVTPEQLGAKQCQAHVSLAGDAASAKLVRRKSCHIW